MRITGVYVFHYDTGPAVRLEFRSEGIAGGIIRPLPEGWQALSRSEKIAWAQEQVNAYLLTRILVAEAEIVYPDPAAVDVAKEGFEAMPGWASWTPAEAAAWIDANVTDLATAKQALGRLAEAVIYLRDIVIES